MGYFEVLVADSSYKRNEPLTYGYEGSLPAGTLVRVPLKRKAILGVVLGVAPKPKFAVKPAEPLAQLPSIPPQLVRLMPWLAQYYASGIGAAMQQILPGALPKAIPLSENATQNSGHLTTANLPPLSPEQQSALQCIDTPQTYLLHGDTGTGKTRIYVELALKAFNNGKSSIILTPEIGLTPQLAKTFQQTFGNENVIITHSQLTNAARNKLWVRMLRATSPLVVIGPRSALFSPLSSIGLIVLDECHESSYKQEQLPHYQSSAVAAKLSSLHRAYLILGSATPNVTDYYVAQQKSRPIIRLQAQAKGMSDYQTAFQVIDLKQHESFSKQPHVSDVLLASVAKSLAAGEQSLLFLNRRGTARTTLCENCGWQALCPNCDVPLTYHGDKHQLLCHTCGFIRPAPSSCPECGSVKIQLRSVGTKAIVEELKKVFPEARIMRFDKDNTKDERLEAHYAAVHAGEVDILVGTQLVTKGLDLPRLSTVGVVIADTGLYFPDFTAQERTYQLLRQVFGRVGRGHRSASVIVQTYDPQNAILKSALTNDWATFYATEMEERKLFTFPPFCFLLKLTCRRATSASAEKAATLYAETLRSSKKAILVEGPSPCFHEKAAGKYQWQLVVKAKSRGELVDVIKSLPANWSFDIDPTNLL